MRNASFSVVFVVIILAILLAGCAKQMGATNLADTTHETIDTKIKNINSKSDALREFGRPVERMTSSGGQEKWVYTYSKSYFYPGSYMDPRNEKNYRKLEIIFDSNGSVENYYFTKGASYYSNR